MLVICQNSDLVSRQPISTQVFGVIFQPLQIYMFDAEVDSFLRLAGAKWPNRLELTLVGEPMGR